MLSVIVDGQGKIAAAHATSQGWNDWKVYGGGPDDIRYSSLKQINTANVSQLEVAWTYDAGDGAGVAECNPIIVDGVLYATTPKHKVVALNAATGKLVWTFDSGIVGRGPNRGVAYWSSGSDKRIFVAVQQFLYALDARTGVPVPAFGTDGHIDLRENLGVSLISNLSSSRRLESSTKTFLLPVAAMPRPSLPVPAIFALTMFEPGKFDGLSTQFLTRRIRYTRLGLKTPGPTSAPRIIGPA